MPPKSRPSSIAWLKKLRTQTCVQSASALRLAICATSNCWAGSVLPPRPLDDPCAALSSALHPMGSPSCASALRRRISVLRCCARPSPCSRSRTLLSQATVAYRLSARELTLAHAPAVNIVLALQSKSAVTVCNAYIRALYTWSCVLRSGFRLQNYKTSTRSKRETSLLTRPKQTNAARPIHRCVMETSKNMQIRLYTSRCSFNGHCGPRRPRKVRVACG